MKNFEKAISMSHSEIVVECDGDDISRPNRVARMVEEFSKDEQVKAVISDGTLFDSKTGRTIGKVFPKYNAWEPLGACMAFSREALVGWQEPNPNCYQDWVYLFRALMIGRVAEIREDLVEYRVGTGISTSKCRKKWSRNLSLCLHSYEQVLSDLSYCSQCNDEVKRTKIVDYINQKRDILRDSYILCAGETFQIRYCAFRRLIEVVFDRPLKGMLRPGPYIDLLKYLSLLLPPGRLDFVYDSVTKWICSMRKMKGIK